MKAPFPPTPSGKRVILWDLKEKESLRNCTAFDDVQDCGDAIILPQCASAIGDIEYRYS